MVSQNSFPSWSISWIRSRSRSYTGCSRMRASAQRIADVDRDFVMIEVRED